jgi:SAM-dependent methyltransferase
MRSNTDRGRRFAFDSVADVYDAGRPTFDDGIIAELMQRAALEAGDQVIEIGAGTGQLTRGLLHAGLRVDALEPGRNLAVKLAQNLGASSDLRVIVETFEAFDEPQCYAAIASANAFHWLDPKVSYRRAHNLLKPHGSLVLLWNFPISADGTLQARLNQDVFTDDLAQFQRDPNDYEGQLRPLLAAGREELMVSGYFSAPDWMLVERRFSISPAGYVDLLNSFANGAGLRNQIAARVLPMLHSRAAIEMMNYVYLSVARRIERTE